MCEGKDICMQHCTTNSFLNLHLQIVNCISHSLSENIFKVKYEKSARHKSELWVGVHVGVHVGVGVGVHVGVGVDVHGCVCSIRYQ